MIRTKRPCVTASLAGSHRFWARSHIVIFSRIATAGPRSRAFGRRSEASRHSPVLLENSTFVACDPDHDLGRCCRRSTLPGANSICHRTPTGAGSTLCRSNHALTQRQKRPESKAADIGADACRRAASTAAQLQREVSIRQWTPLCC